MMLLPLSLLPMEVLLLLALTLPLPPASASETENKRGLVFFETKTPEDSGVWVQKGSVLTWYYNYVDTPSSAFTGIAQDKFEFVPMMWGVDKDDVENDDFLNTIKTLIEEELNISHVLAFNEPDMVFEYGGSDISPEVAAKAWALNFDPLRELGIEVGLPAVTGSQAGIDWINEFLDECKEVLDHDCEFDFVPVHWYGDFPGLASHIGQRLEAYPEKPIWVTEFALNNASLEATQEFFNLSIDHLDNNDQVERYSYFGSFRSNVSNVGENVPFLSTGGEMTDIGSWYLGGNATGVDPTSGDVSQAVGGGMGVSGATLVVGLATLLASFLLA